MRKFVLLLLILLITVSSSVFPVFLKAVTIGPGPVPITRAKNLEIAAERLREKGIDVEIDVTFSREKFTEYRKVFALRYKTGQVEDIHSEDSGIIPEYAENGQIISLDDLISRDLLKDFYPVALQCMTWKGKLYALPIELVVYNIFYRKDVLRKMGYTDEEIEKMLPVNAHGVSLYELIDLAKRAKEMGLVEWGFLHRPSPGGYFHMITAMFGGEFVDEKTGKLIIDTDALLKNFKFHRYLVENGLLPKDMTSWSWKTIHKYIVEGKTLFWIGGHTGQWREWQMVPYHETLGKLSEEYLWENMGIMAFPGPTSFVVAHGYTIVSRTKHKELAAKVLEEAVAPDLLAKHCITTFRGPARKSVLGDPEFQKEKYLVLVSKIIEVARPFPSHPEFSKYNSLIYDAISGIETGKLTPEEALEFVIKRAKAEIKDVIVK